MTKLRISLLHLRSESAPMVSDMLYVRAKRWIGRQTKTCSIQSCVLAAGQSVVCANDELLVQPQKSLVEQRVNIRSQQQVVVRSVGLVPEVGSDVGGLQNFEHRATRHRASSPIRRKQLGPWLVLVIDAPIQRGLAAGIGINFGLLTAVASDPTNAHARHSRTRPGPRFKVGICCTLVAHGRLLKTTDASFRKAKGPHSFLCRPLLSA